MPISVKCPSCGKALKIPDELAGRKVKCPACSTSFTAEAGGGAPAPARAPARAAADDEDDGGEAPSRGSSSAAAGRVKAPAICLLVFAIIAVVLSICNIGYGVLGLVSGGGGGPGPGGEQSMGSPIGSIAGGVFGIILYSLTLLGALKMKNCQSYGMAMTGTITAMLPCSVCCLAGLPIGIWALVVLMNGEVKAAFR